MAADRRHPGVVDRSPTNYADPSGLGGESQPTGPACTGGDECRPLEDGSSPPKRHQDATPAGVALGASSLRVGLDGGPGYINEAWHHAQEDTPIVTDGAYGYWSDDAVDSLTYGIDMPVFVDELGPDVSNAQVALMAAPKLQLAGGEGEEMPRIGTRGTLAALVVVYAVNKIRPWGRIANKPFPALNLRKQPKWQRRPKEPLPIYVTYTKRNVYTGQVYSGRATGYGTPKDIVSARDKRHHVVGRGWGPAIVDRAAPATLPWSMRHMDPAYQAIRGREQQLIDYHGGAISEGGTSANAIRGVAVDNYYGWLYWTQSNILFKETLYTYTGM